MVYSRFSSKTPKKNVRFIDEYFFESWSNNMAYVLGFFAADGCLTKNARRQNYYLEFVSTDLDILEKIKVAMRADQKITKKIPSKVDPSKKQGYRIQIGSKKIFTDLINLGFSPKKSNTITLPAIPNKYFPDFLRGYFDGDGCIARGAYNRKDRTSKSEVITIRLTSGSRAYLDQLRVKLKSNLKLNNGCLYKKQRSGFELVFSTLDTLKILRYIYHCKNCIYLDRKFKKSMEILVQYVGP